MKKSYEKLFKATGVLVFTAVIVMLFVLAILSYVLDWCDVAKSMLTVIAVFDFAYLASVIDSYVDSLK